MTFLPIVVREMRVTARKGSTYWVRFAAAALALLIGAWSFLFLTQMGATTVVGKTLFGGLTGLAWLYAFLGGIFKTADTLSEEKREGTLGLLFLTDLKGYDIVFGKIVAASVNWLFGLLALFPVLALALLMGGVAPGEFWRKVLALTNMLFYSLALGMFVSSFTRNERRAAGLTLALLALFLWAPSELAEWHKKNTGALEFSPWLVFPDVSRPLAHANDFLYTRNASVYWGSLGVSHGIGWLFLLLASLIVPHTWQQQAGKLSRWQENAEQLTYGKNRERRKRFRQRALEINPFYWVASRARGKLLNVMLILAAVLICYALNFWRRPNEWDSPWDFLWPAFWLQGLLKIWIAFEACRRFVEDRRNGALELVLCTPFTPNEIIRGQWRALFRQFGLPILCVLFIDFVLACAGVAAAQGNTKIGGLKEYHLFLLILGVAVIVFIADIFALAWLSMWRGLKARHSYTALLWTLAQLLAGPWVLFYVAFTALMMIVFMPQALRAGAAPTTTITKWMEWLPYIMTVLWAVISLTIAIVSAWWARRCLNKHFRYQATLSYQPPKALWRRPAKSPTLPPRLA
jgi:ABC-type Na+ efflux pump permease subunit